MKLLLPHLRWVVLLALVWSTGASAQEPAPESFVDPSMLSPRNANYEIDVKLDPTSKMLEARQTITWRNIQDQPTDELWFHIYWNAWKNNRSTWLLESRLRGRGDRTAEAQRGRSYRRR